MVYVNYIRVCKSMQKIMHRHEKNADVKYIKQ